MAETSKIQWTDATWNIARGCTKVDEDCKYCYMYRDSMSNTRYNPLEIVRTKTVFNMPLKLKQPSKIFTSSLTDVFHPAIDSYRHEMWEIIRKSPQHTFQILTKRPERIKKNLPEYWNEIKSTVWMGTSVGSPSGLNRIWHLIDADINCLKFLSIEPLYEHFWMLPNHHLKHLHWIIVGGESGNENGKYRYRPCKLEWIEAIVKQCQESGVPVFVKQLGTHLAKELKLKDRHGGDINEWPENLQFRQFPTKKISRLTTQD